MAPGFNGFYDCINVVSETDQAEDLQKFNIPKKFNIPTLVLHGNDDQIARIGAFAFALVQDCQDGHADGVQKRAASHVIGPERQGQPDLLKFF